MDERKSATEELRAWVANPTKWNAEHAGEQYEEDPDPPLPIRPPSIALADLTDEETEEVLRRLGRMVLNLPIVSGQLGHTTAAATIRGNYLVLSTDSRVECVSREFFNDLFKLKTAEMCTKWYGDPSGEAVRRTMKVIA